MSISRHHAEWLSLIEVSGPFLSLPVLSKAFPQGLHAHDAEVSKPLRLAHEEWDDNQGGVHPDPAVHREWIKWVLNNTLDYEECLVEGQAIPQTLKAEIAEHGETLRPEWVMWNPKTKKPRLLVQSYPRQQALSKPVAGLRWKASPDTRMMELLHATNVRLGLVTNGDQWMLVNAPRGETTGFASWYANLWFEEPLTQRALRTLLSAERFFGVEEAKTLEALLDESAEDQQEVTDQLGYQVRRAVEVLIQSLDKADRDYKGQLLKDIDEGRLYEAALTVMMRLVFLFCAEERDLLLLGDDLYDRNYAVSTLREQLQETADQFGEEILGLRYDAWGRLLTTFRAVYGGVQHQDFKLPAYGGHLFDPDRFPFLEGRKSKTSWKESPSQPLPVSNQTVLHLLKSLQLLEVKMPGRKGSIETQKLSFRALDIEQIGHVYEGLLDHTAVRATEPVLGLAGGRNKEPEIPLSELEELLGKGEDELAKVLKKETGRTPKALKNALEAELDDDRVSKFRTACQGDDELWQRVKKVAGLVRIDTFGYPVVIPAKSAYVTSGTDRRSSGTHYTPRSLTEPIVQYTLEPLVYEGPAEGTPKENWKLRSAKELLNLNICDMACGSGAFLVQACRYMSERLLEAWETAEQSSSVEVKITPFGEPSTGETDEQIIPDDPDERIMYARRIVTQRCLYGVDVNPLATEMAKLSLWLLTLAKDKPFTFLDHSIRCGDSLIGITSLSQLERFSFDETGPQKSFAHEQIKRRIDASKSLRQQLEQLPTNTVEDILRKTEMLKRAEEQIGRLRYAADMMLSVHWKPMSDAVREQELQDTLLDVEFKFKDLKLETLAQEAQANLKEAGCDKTFHWALEFPEVFEAFGFDAVIGNPPFMGGLKLESAFGHQWREFVVNQVANGIRGHRGTADLCAYFVLRASEISSSVGCVGLITTNTISEGDTRTVGLAQIGKAGSTIYRAVSSVKWPGAASLEVSLVWCMQRQWRGGVSLDGEMVASISPQLLDSTIDSTPPARLAEGRRRSFIGSYILGTGFTVSPDVAHRLIGDDPQNKTVLFPYLNGEDLNSNVDQLPSRWVINFFNWPIEEAEKYEKCIEIVRRDVKPDRDKIIGRNAESTRRGRNWWLYGQDANIMYSTIRDLTRVIAKARVSKHHMVSFVPAEIVYSDQIVVFAFDDSHSFAVLQSCFQEAWASVYSSSLETRLRYTPSSCAETFPFPSNSAANTQGDAYHSFRKTVMSEREEALTKLYNRFHDAEESSDDIRKLRLLHVEMDNAVAASYGWDDFELDHGIQETKQGIRYTISETARREVLRRLLKLNHERYEDEVTQGLHNKKKKKKSARKKKQKTVKAPAPTLFD